MLSPGTWSGRERSSHTGVSAVPRIRLAIFTSKCSEAIECFNACGSPPRTGCIQTSTLTRPGMNLSLYFVFFLTSCATVATPGPGVLMTLMKSIRWGFKGAIWTICGTATGAVIMACISATGVGLLLSQSPVAYNWLRVLGACYMIWLGIKNWRVKTVSLEAAIQHKSKTDARTKTPESEPAAETIRHFPFFMEGIVLQMTNPMLIMFFVSLFPQFIDEKVDFALQFSVLTFTYFALIIVIHSLYSIATTCFREFLASESMSRWIYRIGGTIFILLALKVLSQIGF